MTGGGQGKWGLWDTNEQSWSEGGGSATMYAAGVPYWNSYEEAKAAAESFSPDDQHYASRTAALPDNAGARDFFTDQTVAQIGRGNIMAISGGRVNPILKGSRTVGISLPVSQGYAVEVYLANNDTYTVQRTFRGRVMGEQTDVYADEVGEAAYQASSYSSNDFGGHKVGSKIAAGERRTLVLPWSEVCMHMGIAGKTMQGESVGNGMVQLYDQDRPFSFPITEGEAGWNMQAASSRRQAAYQPATVVYEVRDNDRVISRHNTREQAMHQLMVRGEWEGFGGTYENGVKTGDGLQVWRVVSGGQAGADTVMDVFDMQPEASGETRIARRQAAANPYSTGNPYAQVGDAPG